MGPKGVAMERRQQVLFNPLLWIHIQKRIHAIYASSPTLFNVVARST